MESHQLLKKVQLHFFIPRNSSCDYGRNESIQQKLVQSFCLFLYLLCISIAGSSLDDTQLPELPSQQRQHGAVDVVQADTRGAQWQTGALDLEDSLIQLSLSWAKPKEERNF